MGENIVFTTRLTADDWDPGIRAWRCPAVDIPSAFIKAAYDPKGQLLEPFREVSNHDDGLASRLSMRRIIARRTKAVALRR